MDCGGGFVVFEMDCGVPEPGDGSEQSLFEALEVIESHRTAAGLLVGWQRSWFFRRRWASWRFETDATDVEVFLEAVGLEEVGELEGADIAAAFADFALQIDNDLADLIQSKALAQEFVPLAFTNKVQAQLLAGQMAVELVGLEDSLMIYRDGQGIVHGGGSWIGGGALNPGTQGTVCNAL